MITKESLMIFWNTGEGQEERSGIIFYGLWRRNFPTTYDGAWFLETWKGIAADYSFTDWKAEDYRTNSVEILISKWPLTNEKWDSLVRDSLVWLVESGAEVSWAGDEYCSPHPDVFDPNKSAGNVYAAYMPAVGLLCNSSLNDEFRILEDSQIEKIFLRLTE